MNQKDSPSRPSLKNPAVLLATWFGYGYLKPAPGTWGSLAALPFGAALYFGGGMPALVIGTMLIIIIGYWAAERYDRISGSHDSKEIVIDEVAGQWIALLPVCFFTGLNVKYIILSFILFRFFDITKPWPISRLDKKVSGPLGVMIDDIVAGVFAAVCIYGVIHFAGLG